MVTVFDMTGEELAETLGGIVSPVGEQCSCGEDSMVEVGPDKFCDHHARDLALQLESHDFVDNSVDEGSLS